MQLSSQQEIRILHVDDDPSFTDLTETFLEREDDRFAVETAASADEGLDQIGGRPPNCIVSGYDMPGKDGIEFLRSVRDNWPDLPFILFTGKGSEEVAGDAISNGATDYLQKTNGTDQYELLANRIENAVSQYQSESRLKQTKKEYATVFEGALNGLLLVDAQGDNFRYQRCNPRAAELIGRDQADIVGCTPCEALGPEDGKKVRGAYRKCIQQREPVEYTVTLDLPVGQAIRPGKVTPIESDGRIKQLVVSFYDVTDERRQQERFRALVEKSNDSLSILDTDGRFQYQSPSIRHILGYDPDEPVGHMAWEYVHPDDRGDALNWFERLGAGETTEPIEYRARHADGSWHWMEAHGNNQLDNPAVEGYVINSRDITARKERQRELEELTSQYQALVDNFPGGGVFLLDKNMCFVRAGGDNLTEVGLNSADFEGNTPHDLYPGEIADEQVHYLERTFDGESHTYRQEFQGSHYELRTMPIRDDMGEVIYAMAVSRNITQLAEQKRELERQNERLEEFVSLISHDLRNPLTVALGRVTVLRQMSNGEAATHLDAIENSLDRMEQITEDTLVLAQKGDSVANMEPVSLPELCRNCWQRVGTVDATLDFEDDIKIKGDTNMLKHIFGNLFRNAIEHGGDSAIISIGRTNETKFYVEDNGPGIPVSNRTDVFNSGHTSERDGTGLGLTIVKRLSEAHGWEVVVSDGSDGGARFEFDNVEFVESE